MGNGSISSSNDQKKRNSNEKVSNSENVLSLDFQYIDKSQFIKYENRVRFRSTDQLHRVIQDFLELDQDNHKTISSDKMELVGIILSGRSCPIIKHTQLTTLQQLNIRNKCLLCFEPIHYRERRKSSQLFLYSPDNQRHLSYSWEQNSTLLSQILEYVIKTFQFDSIENGFIQLSTFDNQNLNRIKNLNKKLGEFSIRNYDSIFVSINSFNCYDQDEQLMNISIQSYSHGTFTFYASLFYTISQLKNEILRRFAHLSSVHVELICQKYENLEKINPKRTLISLNFKTNDIINAFIKEYLDDQQINNNHFQSSSLHQSDIVYLECTLSNNQRIIIEVYLSDTIEEILSKLNKLVKNVSSNRFDLYTKSNDMIDTKQSHRRLIDFGIKGGERIYASILNNNKSIDSSKLISLPRGLVNLGNTCFMNSALQALIHIQPLTNFFLEHFNQLNNSNCGKVTEAYAELVLNMRGTMINQTLDYNSPYEPIRLKEILNEIVPHFDQSDQQDAQEFLIYFLDSMHQEFQLSQKSKQTTIIEQLFFGKILSKIICLNCQNIIRTTNSITFIPLPIKSQQRTFLIHLIRKTNLNCSTSMNISNNETIEQLVQTFLQSQSLSHLFNYLILINTHSGEQIDFDTPIENLLENEITLIEQDEYIPRSQSNQSNILTDHLEIEQFLKEFVSIEKLQDLYYCQEKTCQKKIFANKQFQFIKIPIVLIIQLKRFSYKLNFRQKLDTFIHYPINGLNLNYLLSSSPGKDLLYDLIAVSNHIGSISSGHYTTYARRNNKTDQWYKFDDSYVSFVNDPSLIVNKDAYLLFYIQRQ